MIQIQMYDGDGVEPADLRRFRLQREQDERNNKITADRLVREQCNNQKIDRAKRAQLQKSNLLLNCIRFEMFNVGTDEVDLKILTDDFDQFDDLLEVRRPNMEIIYPPFNPTNSLQHPVSLFFSEPIFKKIRKELLQYPENDPINVVTIRFTHSGMINTSQKRRDGWRELMKATT